MTCEACDIEQSLGYGTYRRVGTAYVFVCGCDKHLKEMFELLRKGGEKDEHDKSIKQGSTRMDKGLGF